MRSGSPNFVCKQKKMNRPINLAYYEQKDWNRFLQMIDDKASMHNTWQEWYKAFEKLENDLGRQGFITRRVIVDIDELNNYCKIQGMKNDGKARSKFIMIK